MNKSFKLFLCLLVPLLVGTISGIATASNIDSWYFVKLRQPEFSPPNYLFGPVWTVLYILMGISFYKILETPQTRFHRWAKMIFGIQLVLNFAWSFLFFKFHLIGIAFIEILMIWLSIAVMIYIFHRINRSAAYLQIPYLLWVSFASALNGAILFLNWNYI